MKDQSPFNEETQIEDYIEVINSPLSDKELAVMNIEEAFRTDIWNLLTPYKGVVTKEYFLKVADEIFINLHVDDEWEWVSKEAVLK
tara:strand:- start:609 stop:866 length:258 start_codon:yes stop_codon:yes gene_type:complete